MNRAVLTTRSAARELDPLTIIRLPRGVVDVWAIDLDAPRSNPFATLDAEERKRADRLCDAHLRCRFAAAHAAKRAILGRYLGLAARAVPLVRQACAGCGRAHGKPALAGHASIAFNLSRSERFALLAVGRGALGVDIEWRDRPLDIDPLLEMVLNAAELAEAHKLPASRRRKTFVEDWVRKESVVKADGAGLLLPLCDVVLDHDRRGARILRPAAPARRYALLRVALDDPAYAAALAVVPPAPRLRGLRWPEDLDAVAPSPRFGLPTPSGRPPRGSQPQKSS